MGTGAAPISVWEVMDFGSVISRVSGESEPMAAKAIHSAHNSRLNLTDNPQNCDGWNFAARCRTSQDVLSRYYSQAPLNLRILCKGIQTTVSAGRRSQPRRCKFATGRKERKDRWLGPLFMRGRLAVGTMPIMGRSPAGHGRPSWPESRCFKRSSILRCSSRLSSTSSWKDKSLERRVSLAA